MAFRYLPVLLFAAALAIPSELPAQDHGARWFPDAFVVQPVAGSRTGIDIGTGPLLVRRDAPAGNGEYSAEADAAFGYRVPVYRFRDDTGGGPALDLGLEGGVIARFALGGGLNGLLNSDFRIAFPFGADFGDVETTLALVHVSSHAGDDFIAATPSFEPKAVSRNGIEARAFLHLGRALRLMGGADYNWAAVRIESVAGHLGLAFDPPADGRARVRPVARIELAASDYTTGPGITGTAGLALPTGAGELRFGVTGHAGPSQMGQFREYDEEYVGVFLGFVPGIVARSADAD
ncbi:MAG: DUF1207 domain-containing protein [Gemmatimonadales bacterium]|jgi:hypothetical protein